jgi:hypothetical protein
LNELLNDALKTTQVILAFETQYKDMGCQVCKVLSGTISGTGAATKIPEKMKSVRFVSGARLCHEQKMSETANNFFFEKKKKNDPRKPEMFYFRLIAII